MTLLNEVKDNLQASKGYNFSEEKWTGEMLSMFYDIVYATEQVIEKQ